MNISVNLLLLATAVLCVLYAIWAVTDPDNWEKWEHYRRKRAGIAVQYRFLVNGKPMASGHCLAGECDGVRVGTWRIFPENIFGKIAIVPARYIKSVDGFRHGLIRVKPGDTVTLEISEKND